MKEYVNVKELLKEVDAMQIRGLIVHVAMKEEID